MAKIIKPGRLLVGYKQLRKGLLTSHTTTIRGALELGAQRITIGARQRAPVDTGLLSSDIRRDAHVDKRPISPFEVQWGVRVDNPYAFHVETGTQFKAPVPFLRGAFDAARRFILRTLSLNLKRSIVGAFKKDKANILTGGGGGAFTP